MISLLLLQNGLESASQLAWFPAAVFIIGALSMAVIQIAKDLSSLRRRLQKIWVMRWIEERAHRSQPFVPKDRYPAFVVEEDLLRLAASGKPKTFYNLPIEELCGQLNAALRAALENPTEHKALISIFASEALDQDLEIFFNPPPSLRSSSRRGNKDRTPVETFAGARNRVSYYVERSIDSLQIDIGGRWKSSLQEASIILSLPFSFIGIGIYRPVAWTSHGIWDRIAIGVLAGYVAPVLRDIMARLQQGSR